MKFHVPLKRVVDDSYDIAIGRGLFATMAHDVAHGILPGANRIALVADEKVASLYAHEALQALNAAGVHKVTLFTFPAGEIYKTRETKAKLEDDMLAAGFNRDSGLIALGGGVVSDLAGFAAGTFGRGIPFLTYSTTLLSAADASVGGKTAVDTPAATNLIGLFNQPRKVYIDIDTWKTLPAREIRSGLAETIKHACLADADFFLWLEKHIADIASPKTCALEAAACEHIAWKNCEIKQSVVVRDERESNLRQVLNLGHTAGRALETLMGYELLHGECVAIGLAVQCAIARQLGTISADDEKRVIALLAACGLPMRVPERIPVAELVAKMHTDKKSRGGRIRFVLMHGIGHMKEFDGGSYSIALEESFLEDVIGSM